MVRAREEGLARLAALSPVIAEEAKHAMLTATGVRAQEGLARLAALSPAPAEEAKHAALMATGVPAPVISPAVISSA